MRAISRSVAQVVSGDVFVAVSHGFKTPEQVIAYAKSSSKTLTIAAIPQGFKHESTTPEIIIPGIHGVLGRVLAVEPHSVLHGSEFHLRLAISRLTRARASGSMSKFTL